MKAKWEMPRVLVEEFSANNVIAACGDTNSETSGDFYCVVGPTTEKVTGLMTTQVAGFTCESNAGWIASTETEKVTAVGANGYINDPTTKGQGDLVSANGFDGYSYSVEGASGYLYYCSSKDSWTTDSSHWSKAETGKDSLGNILYTWLHNSIDHNCTHVHGLAVVGTLAAVNNS